MSINSHSKTNRMHRNWLERLRGIRLSTPMRRRRGQFKSNRVGFFSLWIFISIFIVSLFANVIANDVPLVVHYRGATYFPIVKDYAETEFGGDLNSLADYRDPLIAANIATEGWSIWPPVRFGAYSLVRGEQSNPAPPNRHNWLGTDDQGRDLLAQILYGFRYSILFGLCLTAVSSVIGILAGAVQGYFGGLIDLIFQRVIEIWSGMPQLFMLIILASFVEPNFLWLIGLLLLFSWVELVGVVRAEFLRTRNFEFVMAATALGVPNRLIVLRHILPNALIASLTFLPFILNGSLTVLISLDYLGFGLPPGTPSLGAELRQATANPQAPWLGVSLFVFLVVILCLLIFIGEAVRDAFNPRKMGNPRKTGAR